MEKGFDPHYGARPLKRAIQSYVLNALAKEVIAGRIRSGDRLSVEAKGGELAFVKPGKHGRVREREPVMGVRPR